MVKAALVATTPSVVLPGLEAEQPGAQQLPCVGESAAVSPSHASDSPPGGRIDHIAKSVQDDQGCHRQSVCHPDGGRADTRLHGAIHPQRFADRRAGARADVAFGAPDRMSRIERPGSRTPRSGEPVDLRHEGRKARRRGRSALAPTEREPNLALFKIPHDARRAVEPECAAPGEHDGVHLLNAIDRIEQVRFAGRRRRSPYVDACRRACLSENHRASGGPLVQRVVPDLDAGHRRQGGIPHCVSRRGRSSRCRAE